LVPTKHRGDSLCELRIIRFIDATSINPKVLDAVPPSLFFAEPDLVIACSILAGTICQISERDLLGIRSPCVRKYSIGGNVVVEGLGEAELAAVDALQKTH
jgi:hypothetical protein